RMLRIAMGVFVAVAFAARGGAAEMNPREVTEAYLAAALTGKPADAAKLAVEGQSPSREKTAEGMKSFLGVEKVPVAKVLASDAKGRAIAVSGRVKVKDSDGTEVSGCVCLSLTKTADGWRVKDIDFTSEETAALRLAEFSEK